MARKQFEQLTEIEIINRVLEGEKPLFELILRRFNPYLYKIGRSYDYNHEDTQDLMQETYIDAFRSLSKFKQNASFKTWLTRIMLNNCYRKKQKFSYANEFARDTINENANPMFSNSDKDINQEIHSKELGSIIEKALLNIPEDYRLVFTLREMNGFNVAETAELLDISESNVKVRLNRAKAMLQNEISKSYVAEELYDFHLRYCNPFTERVMKIIDKL